jgi:hypothetical protein
MDESPLIPDWLPSGAAALQSFLQKNPKAEERVREILDPLLEKIDANSGATLVTGLDSYFGQEITDMLFDLVQPMYKDHLQDFNEVIPADAMRFLQGFTTNYGAKLINVTQASTQFNAAALEAFLKAHPDAEAQVLSILAKHLDQVSTNSWNAILMSLDSYWGKESTNSLIDIARDPDQASRLEEVSTSASPEVMNFLRKVMSRHGSELLIAFQSSNQLPNGWKTFYRDVYYDYVNRRTLIRVRLAKYNGEEPYIEGNADTMLELTILMMQTLRFLPVPELISKGMSERFIREANDFIKFLQPPELKTSDSGPESKPTK